MFVSRSVTHEMDSSAPKVGDFLRFISDHREIMVAQLEIASTTLRNLDGKISLTEQYEDGRMDLEEVMQAVTSRDYLDFPSFL